MERLTERCDLDLPEVEQTAIIVPDDREGLYDIYDLANNYTEEWAHKLLEKIILRLAEYEDTNLTPSQLKEIDTLYLEKCQEVNKLKEQNLTEPQMIKLCTVLTHYEKLLEQGRLVELPLETDKGNVCYIYQGSIYVIKIEHIGLPIYKRNIHKFYKDYEEAGKALKEGVPN